jgi:hypothetical protein
MHNVGQVRQRNPCLDSHKISEPSIVDTRKRLPNVKATGSEYVTPRRSSFLCDCSIHLAVLKAPLICN